MVSTCEVKRRDGGVLAEVLLGEEQVLARTVDLYSSPPPIGGCELGKWSIGMIRYLASAISRVEDIL